MTYEILGNTLPVALCRLENGESVVCEKGSMSWMSDKMKMQTNAGGSFGKMLTRAVSGESIFQNVYTATGGEGEIAFASSFPGKILAVDVSEKPIVAQKSAFLACESNVRLDLFFQRKLSVGFFGGEGFIMQKFSGNGIVFLEIDGSCVEYELAAGESMLIDTGYIAAMDETCKIEIEAVKGVGNKLFGGEGFFNTRVSGPGHIWLQSMPKSKLSALYAPQST